jgi:hypothetical protein
VGVAGPLTGLLTRRRWTMAEAMYAGRALPSTRAPALVTANVVLVGLGWRM